MTYFSFTISALTGMLLFGLGNSVEPFCDCISLLVGPFVENRWPLIGYSKKFLFASLSSPYGL